MDIETVHELKSESPWDGRIAVLVACAALIAALLGVLEVHSSKNEEKNLLMASRRSVQVFTRLATRGIVYSLQTGATRDAVDLTVEAQLRQLTGIQGWSVSDAEAALADADIIAAQQVTALAATLGTPPKGQGLDPQTEAVLAADQDAIDDLVVEQNELVDDSARFSERSTKAVSGLSLLAIAAVMIALAGLFGQSRQGRLALSTATGLLALSAAWGAWALLI